jgi:hypothetical protein
VSSHILLSWGRSFANEIAGAGPTSFAVNLTHVPSPRTTVLVFGFGEKEGTRFSLNGIGFGGGPGMHWWGMVLMEWLGGWMLRSDGRIDSDAAI